MQRSKDSTSGSMIFLAGAATGAALMALLDTGRGASRRAYVRGKLLRAANLAAREGWKQVKNARNNLAGAVAETKAKWTEGYVPDGVLVERVKAQLGHVVSHWNLDVRAHNGHVILEGPVLTGEKEKIASRLNDTRGVRSYELRLTEHASAEGVPSLQGESRQQRKGIA